MRARLHHPHDRLPARGSRLLVALGLTSAVFVVEVGVGLTANSLALVSDAGHILTDVFALGLAYLAIRRSVRPPDERHTFGYRRTGILAALANASMLIVIAVVIGFEAFSRIQHVQHVRGIPVVAAATLAVVVNLFIASSLYSDRSHDLNVRAAFMHVTGDIAASVAVIISGIVVALTQIYALDPLISLAIAGLIAVGAWRILTQTAGILMEGTPQGIDVARVDSAMREVPGVEDVHDLHVWSLSDGFRLLSAHVTIPDQSLSSASALVSDLRLVLSRRFQIQHSTIEVECDDCTVPVTRTITMHTAGQE